MNSKVKGKVGEREFAEFLRNHGFEARRGQQFSGSPESPDVISNIPNIHWEVKRVERLNIEKAMKQAITDAGTLQPVVAHRRNLGEWMVTMKAEDFLKYVELASYNKPL